MNPFETLGQMAAMLFVLVAGTALAGDMAAIVENCDGCHGKGGVSDSTDMPTIAGISEFVHFDALLAYAEGARPCAKSQYLHGDTSRDATDMCAVVEGMSEGEMEAISQHYAAKPFVAAKQEFDAALAASGEAIHAAACEKCHTENGSFADDDASILAGQQMGYLRTTFAQYAAGERDQPKSMKTKMDALSAEDTEALIHFYASQQ